MTDDRAALQDVEIYGVGLIYASVCSELGPDATVERVNELMPTGLSNGARWQLSEDERFATGEPNGCPCETRPDTRRHYLLEC